MYYILCTYLPCSVSRPVLSQWAMAYRKTLGTRLVATQGPRNRGALGASAPTLFVPREKVPFFGNESALFSWNRSALLAKRKCPFWSVPPHFRDASTASVATKIGSVILDPILCTVIILGTTKTKLEMIEQNC